MISSNLVLRCVFDCMDPLHQKSHVCLPPPWRLQSSFLELYERLSPGLQSSVCLKKTFAIIGYLLIISINRTLWDRFSKTALRPLRMKAVWLSQPSTCSLAVLSFPYPGTEYEGSSSTDKSQRLVLEQLSSRCSYLEANSHFHNSWCLVGRETQLQEELRLL